MTRPHKSGRCTRGAGEASVASGTHESSGSDSRAPALTSGRWAHWTKRSGRDGNRRIYHADPTGVRAMRVQLDRFWNQALATFKEVVEQDNEKVK